jgi:hypothetical protein
MYDGVYWSQVCPTGFKTFLLNIAIIHATNKTYKYYVLHNFCSRLKIKITLKPIYIRAKNRLFRRTIFYTLPSYYSKIHFNIILSPAPIYSKVPFNLRLSNQTLYAFVLSSYVPHVPPITFIFICSPEWYFNSWPIRRNKPFAPHSTYFPINFSVTMLHSN